MLMFDLTPIPARNNHEGWLWGALEQFTPGAGLTIAPMEEPCSCDGRDLEVCQWCDATHCDHYDCADANGECEFDLADYPDESRQLYLLGWHLAMRLGTEARDVDRAIEDLFPGQISGLIARDRSRVLEGVDDCLAWFARGSAS